MTFYPDCTSMLHRRALNIAHKRKPVFPCKPDKSPYTPRGFKDATTNPGRVSALFTEHTDALIAMRTGSRSALFVVDEDRPKAVDELEQKLPETLTIRTPSGGRHFYFKHVDGIT